MCGNSFIAIFFGILYESLKVKGNDPLLPVPSFGDRPWVDKGISSLKQSAIAVARSIASAGFPDVSVVYRALPPFEGITDHDDFQDLKSLRRAVIEITNDLVLLGRERRQDTGFRVDEFKAIQESSHFIFDDWAESYLTDGLALLDRTLADETIKRRSETQRSQFSEFGDRAESALLLCDLALFSGLKETAHAMLLRALRCIYGYGHRKDITLAVFMDSLDEVSGTDRAFTTSCIRRIAPIIDSILETTDGKEARHTRYEIADYLLRFMPDRFPAYHAHLLREGSWYAADQVLARLIKFCKQSQHALSIVGYAVNEESSAGALAAIANDPQSIVAATAAGSVQENAMLFGEVTTATAARASEPASPLPSDSVPDIAIDDFGPTEFLKILRVDLDPSLISHRSKIVKDWTTYWASKGRGSEVLASIRSALKEPEFRLEAHELLDTAFNISLQLEGPRKAYRWLVDGQILSSGWSEYYSEEQARARFNIVKEHYPSQWTHFLLDSARLRFDDDDAGPFIPTERLVQFLVIVGEINLARNVVECMLRSLEEDFRDQPLAKPEWLEGMES